MGDVKRFHSLTFKMMTMVLIAAVCAVVVFVASILLGGALIDRVYLSEESVSARMNREITSFRQYVSENGVSSTNVAAIGRWNREHDHIQLTIYGLSTTVSSDSNGAELVGNESGLVIRDGALSEGTVEYAVNFSDGTFAVAVYDGSGWLYVVAVTVAALILAVVVFLATVLLYDQHITRTVQTLSRQVRQVSRGDLEMQIKPMTQDEIGQLALDVDTMRLSIIDKLQREEAAWQANTQLITAISHDVRTPLTALMGYLEILSDESIDPEERQAYLQVCKNNAVRLKSLTDELFGFFLVFGKPTVDQSVEEFDAAMLLDQILMEHEMNLNQNDFRVELVHGGEVTGKLRVDLTHLRRVFDNLFSNVNKYADHDHPVTIAVKRTEDDLMVSITNYIALQSNRRESNRIGLQTCHKLVQAMGGEFSQSRTKDTFTVAVLLPLIEE